MLSFFSQPNNYPALKDYQRRQQPQGTYSIADPKYITHSVFVDPYVWKFTKKTIFHTVDERTVRCEGFVRSITHYLFLLPHSNTNFDDRYADIVESNRWHSHRRISSRHIHCDKIYSKPLSLIGLIEICIKLKPKISKSYFHMNYLSVFMLDQINHSEYNAFDYNTISDGMMWRLIKNLELHRKWLFNWKWVTLDRPLNDDA